MQTGRTKQAWDEDNICTNPGDSFDGKQEIAQER